MGRHRPDRRRVKIHYSYAVDEAARLLGVSKGTVRRWLKTGLAAVDAKRPSLIRGQDLRDFLVAKTKPKQPCPPGTCYCVKCKTSSKPGGAMAEFIVITPSTGNLRAICPACGTLMHRRTSLAQLEHIREEIEVTIVERIPRLGESPIPSTNVYLKGAERTCGNSTQITSE